ncbi:SdpI family protein [Rhodococcus sp. (in: high G+C Gram-positive bacteria)]|uniref:SdpI family protein n=1 Tax=Rhodococcus sp. TaxID=1831 RepID=UPI003B8A6839
MDSIGLRITLCLTFVIAGIAIAWTSRAAASGRLGRNSLAGIRTPTTMHSDETWSAAHRASRTWTDIGGGLSIAIGFGALVPMSEPMLTALGLAGAACLLGFTLCGAWVGVRAARDAGSDRDQAVSPRDGT